MNDRRFTWLQQAPQTRYSARGVIAIDNTLVIHAGKLIETWAGSGIMPTSAHVIAHDYLISTTLPVERALSH